MEEIQTKLQILEDYSASLEVDIQTTKEQIFNEEDETHIIFLNDHLRVLRFEFHKVNADIYLFRRKVKKFKLN